MVVHEFLQPTQGKPHVVVVLGKGGVGKTTTSIMIASELSRLGNTLLVSFDPAKHIIKYLNIKEPMKTYEISNSFHAYQLDINLAIKEVTSQYIDLLNELLPSLTVLNMENVVKVLKYMPGMEEEVFLRKLMEIYKMSKYDYVVVDTPPTGVALRTLALPRLYGVWVEKLIEIREKIVALRYVVEKTLGKSATVHDPALKKLYTMREEYGQLSALLSDATRTSYVAVANPEPLPIHEMKEVVAFLENELGTKPKLLVLNKVFPRDVAEKLGVAEQQSKYIEEIRSMPYNSVVIEYVTNPPSSLEDVNKLLKTTYPLRRLYGST